MSPQAPAKALDPPPQLRGVWIAYGLAVPALIGAALFCRYGTELDWVLLWDESGVFEWTSAVFFALSALVGCLPWLLRLPCPWWACGVPLGGLLGFQDELSFLENYLGVESPWIAGVRIDGVHDFLEVAWRLLGEPEAWLLYGFVGLAAVLGLWILLRSRTWLVRTWATHTWLRFCVLAVAWFLPAAVLDLHIFGDGSRVRILEEVLEAVCALSWLFAALALLRSCQQAAAQQAKGGTSRG